MYPTLLSFSPPALLSAFLMFLAVVAGCESGAPAPPASQTDPLDGERINNFYTNEEIRLFLDVALGTESEENDDGTPLHMKTLSKWTTDIRVALMGRPTEEDRLVVQNVINEINPRLGQVSMRIDSARANVYLYFVRADEYHLYEPDVEDVTEEFAAYIWPDILYGFDHASLFFPTDTDSTDYYRAPMIRYGLTFSLGLLYRSSLVPESIFYTYGTYRPAFAPIDRTVIELLYHPEIRSGMTRGEILRALTDR